MRDSGVSRSESVTPLTLPYARQHTNGGATRTYPHSACPHHRRLTRAASLADGRLTAGAACLPLYGRSAWRLHRDPERRTTCPRQSRASSAASLRLTLWSLLSDSSPGARLITLTGAGGVGKTRLALEAPPGSSTHGDQPRATPHRGRNHAPRSVARSARRARLATIRSAGECEAVRLFVERAEAGFRELSPDRRDTRPRLPRCAPVWTGFRSHSSWQLRACACAIIQQIAQRLDDRFRTARGRHAGAPSHQQTLEATVAWSYETCYPRRSSACFAVSRSLPVISRRATPKWCEDGPNGEHWYRAARDDPPVRGGAATDVVRRSAAPRAPFAACHGDFRQGRSSGALDRRAALERQASLDDAPGVALLEHARCLPVGAGDPAGGSGATPATAWALSLAAKLAGHHGDDAAIPEYADAYLALPSELKDGRSHRACPHRARPGGAAPGRSRSRSTARHDRHERVVRHG